MSDEAMRLRLVTREQAGGPALAEAVRSSEGLLDTPGERDHIVRFYQDEELLYRAVVQFVAAGLAAEEPVVIVATEAHRTAFVQRLRRQGIAVDAAVSSGRITLLDARETLARFMVGDDPKWDRFAAAIGPVLDRCRAGRTDVRVRVYGEMVDVLWRAGNRVAAIRLEEFWNELARQQSFALLCAYHMGNFYKAGDGEGFDDVCRLHSHVIAASSDQVRALEAELEERRQLEGALRQALQQKKVSENAAEERSLEDAERMRLLIDSVEEYAIFMLDPQGHVSSWNPGAQRIKGYRADEIIGQHFSRFYPPEEIGKCAVELEVAARDGRFEDEGWRVRKDGTRFWANVVIHRVLDRDGRLVGFAKVTRDLTHRRQLEEERVARAALERALAEQKKQEELREQLIGIVGHDLRTPLSSIVMGAGMMLKRGTLSENDAKTMARIARSADRMAKIISQLLDFTRARLGGGIRIDARPMDLAEVCSEVISELETANPDRTIRIAADGDTRGTWDRDRLSQVVQNLVGNALQHGAAHGAVDVSVAGEGDSVVLSVHNEGPAISPALLPIIFDPFRRQNNATRKTEGLGLGLYICREMVRAHGGDISVRSAEGTGTAFTVTVPRRR
jgi:PAS domain S-box-containing protein